MAQYKGAASEAGRAQQIVKRREREQEELEQKRRKVEETLKINKIENKFAVHYDAVEQQLKVSNRCRAGARKHYYANDCLHTLSNYVIQIYHCKIGLSIWKMYLGTLPCATQRVRPAYYYRGY